MEEALVFLADGSEEIESVSAINILRRGGVLVKSVSITAENTITGSRNIKIQADLKFSDLTEDILNNVKMIIFPGGLGGYESFKKHTELTNITKSFISNKKYIAAICAAPSFLGENGFLSGVKATCYPGFEKNLKNAILANEDIVIDNNFITAKGPGFSVNFALKILLILKGEQVYKKVKSELLIES